MLPALFLVVLPYLHFIFILLLESIGIFYYGGKIAFLSILLIPFLLLPLAVKRLHDIGWSGWFSLLILPAIPFTIIVIFALVPDLDSISLFNICVNLLFILFLLIKKGQEENNKYGQVPMYQKKKIYILFWILLVILPLAYVFLVDFERGGLRGGPVPNLPPPPITAP